METKTWIYLLLLIGVIGGTYAIYLDQETASLQTSVDVTKQNIVGIEGQLQQRAKQLQIRQSVAGLLVENTKLKQEKERLEAELKQVKERLPSIQNRLRQAIEKVRRETVGMTLPELTLNDGSSLQEAIIQQVLEDEVVIRHSQGIRRVPAKLLPANLKDRLRPGALAEAAPPASKPIHQPPQAKTSLPPALDEIAAKQQEKKLLEARLAIEKMRHDLRGLDEQLSQAESDLAVATSPSRKYYAENRRNHFRSLVQAQKDKISNAELALARLQAEANAP
jgi:hypothetical protein